ncbi:MAG: OadG family protein [Clostridia bacterium]|nr:OadG family protein [Clostridia bacterium]
MKNLLLALIDGNGRDFGDGALVSVLAIVLVFTILAIIIAVTYAIGKTIEKKSSENSQQEQKETVSTAVPQTNNVKLDLSDEDAVVATLVASIDYREKTKKDFKVISVKEIK